MINQKEIIPSEHEEQAAFVRWFRLTRNELIYAIPNGEKRHISVAKRLKKEGVLAGVPDLFIPERKLYIEFKRKKGGTLSKQQREVIPKLEAVGYTVLVAKGYSDAVIKFNEFLSSMATKN